MTKRSTKPVGEVLPVPTMPGKFMVRVTRYPSGRKLPAPRIVLCADGSPFNTAMQALGTLRTWQADPRGAVALKVTDKAPRAPRKRKPRGPVTITLMRPAIALPDQRPASAGREVNSRRPAAAPAPCPPPAKRATSASRQRPASPDADLVAQHIAAKGVTHGAAYDRPGFRSKHGGAMPAYLNPVQMGTRETPLMLPCTAIRP